MEPSSTPDLSYAALVTPLVVTYEYDMETITADGEIFRTRVSEDFALAIEDLVDDEADLFTLARHLRRRGRSYETIVPLEKYL